MNTVFVHLQDADLEHTNHSLGLFDFVEYLIILNISVCELICLFHSIASAKSQGYARKRRNTRSSISTIPGVALLRSKLSSR